MLSRVIKSRQRLIFAISSRRCFMSSLTSPRMRPPHPLLPRWGEVTLFAAAGNPITGAFCWDYSDYLSSPGTGDCSRRKVILNWQELERSCPIFAWKREHRRFNQAYFMEHRGPRLSTGVSRQQRKRTGEQLGETQAAASELTGVAAFLAGGGAGSSNCIQ